MKDTSILSSNGVDLDQALEFLGDMETYDEIMEDFLSGTDERLSKMKEYKEAFDMENYAILVHALKSDSKYLGFTKLAELAYQHEMESKANNIEYINNNYDELISEANKIKSIINNYLGK